MVLAAAPREPGSARCGGVLHPIRLAFLQKRRRRQFDANASRIAVRAVCFHPLPSTVADHDLLLDFVAAVSHGPEQSRRAMDAALRIQSLALEQAVHVMALVTFPCSLFFNISQVLCRSIGVDVQYFVCAVIAIFACSFAPSRAPALLFVLATSCAVVSVALSIQGASNLIFTSAASELHVPMPVIGIDWMQVRTQPSSHVVVRYSHSARSPAGGCHESCHRRLLLLSVSQVQLTSCLFSLHFLKLWQRCAPLPAVAPGSGRRALHPRKFTPERRLVR
jgi:hypothetical protein